MMKTTNKSKVKIGAIAVLSVGGGIFLAPTTADAFNFTLTGFVQNGGINEYKYSLTVNPGESFAPAQNLTLTNLVGVTDATVNGSAAGFFNSPIFNQNTVIWTTSRAFNGSTNFDDDFSVFSSAPPGQVNWSFNANGNPTSGPTTGPAPVPEPMTTLLASTVALGFGGWLKREQSKLQKKLKDKSTT